MIMRTHKIALRPTRRQHRLLEQCSDYARFAYNWTLRYFRGKPAAEREKVSDQPALPCMERRQGVGVPLGEEAAPERREVCRH